MKKIIFVDDDDGILDIAKLVFERDGYQITLMSNGETLLQNAFELPDVFILDKQLPGMDGLDICRTLKNRESTKDIPVIMLSANPDIRELARNAGADEVMEKPFTLQALRDAVARHTA
ncbi:response regulator [Compostibacter hankyongensis]|uniref:Response regulatory domain-containing protein n=1 Tax=Compostibacter hankyongensis TaxID=1007089 RepID=A0ABP8FPN5_9BACT